MRVGSSQDAAAGLIFVAAGAAGFILSLDLSMGSGMRMGAGYLPRVLSLCLLGLGGVITAKGVLFSGNPFPRLGWKPLIVVLGTILFFAAAMNRLGIAPTTLVAVLIATLAAPDRRWVEAAAFGLLMAVFCVSVFVFGLGLNIPIWPVL